MSTIPDSLHYTEEHEYVKPTDENGIVQIGITDYAQGELGDVVYVELPEVGATFGKMEEFGTIEAVKAVSQLFCPVAGEVVEINDGLEADPRMGNKEPYGEGGMTKPRGRRPAELDRLLTATDYTQHVGE